MKTNLLNTRNARTATAGLTVSKATTFYAELRRSVPDWGKKDIIALTVTKQTVNSISYQIGRAHV